MNLPSVLNKFAIHYVNSTVKFLKLSPRPLIQSIHLPENWEPIVRQMLDNERERADPEAERKDLVHIMIQEVALM